MIEESHSPDAPHHGEDVLPLKLTHNSFVLSILGLLELEVGEVKLWGADILASVLNVLEVNGIHGDVDVSLLGYDKVMKLGRAVCPLWSGCLSQFL